MILHPDGSEKIYVAANSINDGVLACFNNRQGKIAAAENWPTGPLKGLWSQPVLDQLSPGTIEKPTSGKQIYAVQVVNNQGTLTGIDWLTGATKDMTPTFAVGDSPYLLNGGNLALDQTGNCFVWNGQGKIGLFTFGNAFSGLLQSSASGIPMKAQLFFGGDGTLYANTVDGNRVLRAIVPQYNLDKLDARLVWLHLQPDQPASGRHSGRRKNVDALGTRQRASGQWIHCQARGNFRREAPMKEAVGTNSSGTKHRKPQS